MEGARRVRPFEERRMTNTARQRSTLRLVAAGFATSLALTAVLPCVASAQDAPVAPAAAKGGVNLASAGMGVLDKALNKADATPDQKAKIKAILLGAFMSLAGQAPALKATAASYGAALMAPDVDRAGLERARVSTVAEFDAFSKVMVQAIGDAAEVLTPEQRAKLAASAKPKG
jgi:protein CpxP